VPVSNDENDINLATWLQNQIQSDGRLDAMKRKLVENWLTATGFKKIVTTGLIYGHILIALWKMRTVCLYYSRE
jgi:hypothetical protein